MRTKTLLLTAALGLAGAASTMAQVYSVNAVGYVNTTVCPGFNLIANPLDNKNPNGNTVQNLFAGAPAGLQVFVYRSGAFDTAAYDPDFGGWTKTLELPPGEGFWVLWPNQTKGTVTFVGDVPQGHLVNPIPAGLSIRGSMVPQQGLLATDLKYPVANGDLIQTYNYDQNCANGGYAAFPYDPDFGGWSPQEPTIGVGQGFWVLKTAAVDWVRDFDVNKP